MWDLYICIGYNLQTKCPKFLINLIDVFKGNVYLCNTSGVFISETNFLVASGKFTPKG